MNFGGKGSDRKHHHTACVNIFLARAPGLENILQRKCESSPRLFGHKTTRCAIIACNFPPYTLHSPSSTSSHINPVGKCNFSLNRLMYFWFAQTELGLIIYL